MNQISPLAFVHPEAKLGDNNIIGPFCYIDKDTVWAITTYCRTVLPSTWALASATIMNFPRRQHLYQASGLEVQGRADNMRGGR